MVSKILHTFTVEYTQTLDENGTVDQSRMPNVTEGQIKEMYHLMKLTRQFDEKLFALQRSGKIGTFAQVKGQEACQIGSGMALNKDDWVAPSFREFGVFITRGVDRVKLVQGWNGDNRAFEADPATCRNLPVAIPIASQCLHACGLAWAEKIKGTKNIAITYLGDGGTSEGDFHEALNFAGEYKLPIVIFCQNNQWAISTPRNKQTASETIAQKAIAYGIRGIQIDGNDVLGVYKTTQEAIERARNGEGPTLIEAMTFRMGDHTTSDDAQKYRDPRLVEEWASKDPILRLEKYFQQIGTWSDDYKVWVEEENRKEIEDAVAKALAIGAPPPEDLIKHIFKTPPKHLLDDLALVNQEIAEKKQVTQTATPNTATSGGSQ
jgi:pyruvate dehydrogenase E1 component alpha subunit